MQSSSLQVSAQLPSKSSLKVLSYDKDKDMFIIHLNEFGGKYKVKFSADSVSLAKNRGVPLKISKSFFKVDDRLFGIFQNHAISQDKAYSLCPDFDFSVPRTDQNVIDAASILSSMKKQNVDDRESTT